jgi:ATPase family associated with various cellular activities (AAA)
MKKFITYLDTYKETNDIQPIQYISILDQINMHFLKNRLSIMDQKIHNPISNYSLWQNNHDFTYQFDYLQPSCIYLPHQFNQNDVIKSILKKPKEYKHIDMKIESIQDLLSIIEKYPYNDAFQYNIDIRILHSIKNELSDLNQMIGLSTFKTQIVDQLLYFIQNLHQGEKEIQGDYKHTVLFGPPGTGKTEIAKIIGQMYSKIGILHNSTFKKVSRSDLIAGYLGQTAIKTQKVIESSLGGVLFIDEAYSLADSEQRDSFSKECIDTLCEALSQYRDNWMVIIAGYEEEIKQQFFKTNPGLESRFIWRFTLDSYSPAELFEIFKKKVLQNGWTFELEGGEGWFQKNKAAFPFLGRDMEALFTYTKIAHSRRIFGTSIEKKRIIMEDLEKGFETFQKFSKNKIEKSVLYDMYC